MTERSRTVQPLPELTGENVESLMRERIAATKTEKTVVPMLWQGLLEMKISTGKEERSAILYVPREIPQGSPFVFLNVPEGEETVNFLIESGWMDAADRDSFCLFAAQPVNGHWGSAADEVEYLKTCYREEQTGRYFLPQLSAYVVGYGEIGAELQKVVMEEPIFVAAAAFLDASALDPVWLSKHKEGNFHFGTETIDIPFAEVPVPVWICSRERNAETEAAARFWIDASRAKENGEDPDYGNIYLQAADSMFTPEGHILKVAVRQEALSYKSRETTERIWNFVRQYYRYGRGTHSNMISRKVDYAAMGVDFHRFTDQNGIEREYLVYVPASCAGKKAPLVLILHGASQTMRNMFENGLWYEIAEREGFVVASAESGLGPMPTLLSGDLAMAHRPLWHDVITNEQDTDMEYLDELADRLAAEYPIDPRRIYLTGHSMGCMTPIYLGTSKAANRFAAIAATSGIAMKKNKLYPERRGGMPIFLTMGEYDLWPYAIDKQSPLTDALDTYLIENGLADRDNVEEIRVRGAEQSQHGMYHDFVWKDAQGVPRVKYCWLEKWGHVSLPAPNYRFWNEWFSKWRLDENGDRIYDK